MDLSGLFLGNPFFSGLSCGFVLVAVALCPTRRERFLLAAACLGVEAMRIYTHWTPAFVGLLTVTGTRAAAVALAHLVLSGGLRPALRPLLLRAVAQSACLPLLYTTGNILMTRDASTPGMTYDLFYYAADLKLGPPWCFQVVAWTHQSFLFYTLGHLAYFFLSHVMALVAAWWVLSPRGPNPILYFAVCALLTGVLGYWICPGVGPEVVFGTLFPFNPPPVDAPMLLEVPGGHPRNTMPSLHLLWAYSVWISLSGRQRALSRAGLVYLVTMPLVAFLGRHFLVDYVVALGLASGLHLLVHKLSAPAAPIDPKLQLSSLGALLCAPAYLFLLVSASSIWKVWPWVLQLATMTTLALAFASSFYLHQRLTAAK